LEAFTELGPMSWLILATFLCLLSQFTLTNGPWCAGMDSGQVAKDQQEA
jgi:hypothetical protein